MIKTIYINFSLFVILTLLFLTGCDQFGAIPTKDDHLRMQESSNYSKTEDQLLNQNPRAFKEMQKKSGFWSNPKKNLSNNFFFNSNVTKPESLLPEDKYSLNAKFVKSNNNIKFAWLGHSSILMSINNKVILIDPIFASSASPFSWLVKRYQPPVFKLKELPKVDFILISHDHYDHLDMETIKFYGGNPANFLDVGGTATQERVAKAFKIILADPEVKVVLVNIFGGIVRCDLIAEGILAAIEEVGVEIPVVVRLEGNNAEIGSKILSESGIKIESKNDLADAAKKAVELSK